MIKNWFHKDYEYVHFRLAQRLLSGKTASFDDLSAAAGFTGERKVSNRSLALVLMMIEDQCGVLVKKRSSDYGILYRFVPDGEFDQERALTDPNGSMAKNPMVRNYRGKMLSSNQQPRRF